MSKPKSATYASILLGRSEIRFRDGETGKVCDKKLSNLPKSWTPEDTKSYVKSMLELLPRKLDALILIDPVSFELKLYEAAVEGATEGTKVKVISALMARLLFVTTEYRVEEGQHLIILTMIMDSADFHVLTRKDHTYFLTHEYLTSSSNLSNILNTYCANYPNCKVVIVFDEHNKDRKNQLIKACEKEVNQVQCNSWNDMLLNGGLFKASTLTDDVIKQVVDVKDFTIGYQVSSDSVKTTLIEPGTPLPYKDSFEVKIVRGNGQVRTNPTICFNEKFKHRMNINEVLTDGTYQIEIDLKENGTGCIKVDKVSDEEDLSTKQKPFEPSLELKQSSAKSKERELSPEKSRKRRHPSTPPKRTRRRWDSSPTIKRQSSSRDKEASPDDSRDRRVPFSKSLNPASSSTELVKQNTKYLTFPSRIHYNDVFMICFNDNWVCAALPQRNGKSKMIVNGNGNKWTPFYLSFAREEPTIGEVALYDFEQGSKCVLYDAHKFLGIPPDNVVIKPDWPFTVCYTGDGPYKKTALELDTYKGRHCIDPMMAYCVFMIGMRKEAERVAGRPLNRVFIKKTNPVGRVQAEALKEAALLADLQFTGIETIPRVNIEDTL